MSAAHIHNKVLTLFKQSPCNLKKLLKDDPELTKYSDDDVLRLLFKNFRTTHKGTVGLRLTFAGHNFISQYYEQFLYSIGNEANLTTLFLLDKYQIWPYYISRSYAIFYNGMDASMFKLCNGDINQYAETLKDG